MYITRSKPIEDNGHVTYVLQRYKYAHNIQSDLELSDFLGVPNTTISSWRTRNSFGKSLSLLLIKARPGLNEEWLLKGIGQPFDQTAPQNQVDSSQPIPSDGEIIRNLEQKIQWLYIQNEALTKMVLEQRKSKKRNSGAEFP